MSKFAIGTRVKFSEKYVPFGPAPAGIKFGTVVGQSRTSNCAVVQFDGRKRRVSYWDGLLQPLITPDEIVRQTIEAHQPMIIT